MAWWQLLKITTSRTGFTTLKIIIINVNKNKKVKRKKKYALEKSNIIIVNDWTMDCKSINILNIK